MILQVIYMEKIQLSKRLKAAAKYVKPNLPIADIGSDHAYLPIYLVQNHIISSAIAGEVVKGPFDNATNKVLSVGLEKKISVRLGSGLEVLTPEDNIGTITICGMGGILMAEILKEGLNKSKIPLNARLVLQPNNAEDILRDFLRKNHFKIISETIIEENNKLYEIIVAEHHLEYFDYSETELTFGPLLVEEKSPLFMKKWQKELALQETILEKLKNSNDLKKIKQIKEKICHIKEVL